MSSASSVTASFTRFYYTAWVNQDIQSLKAIYANDSQLVADESKVSGPSFIINAHQQRLQELGKIKINLVHVDSAQLPTKQVSINIVGSVLTELTEIHFVQSFVLAPTEGRDNTYYVQYEYRRNTNTVHDRNISKAGKKDEVQQQPAPSAAVQQPSPAVLPATVPATVPAAAPARRNRREEREQATTAPAPVEAAPVAAKEQRAPRERRERKRACVEIEGIQRRTTIGDIEAACATRGKVLALKWSARDRAVVEFLSLRVANELVANQGLEIHGKPVSARVIDAAQFDDSQSKPAAA